MQQKEKKQLNALFTYLILLIHTFVYKIIQYCQFFHIKVPISFIVFIGIFNLKSAKLTRVADC